MMENSYQPLSSELWLLEVGDEWKKGLEQLGIELIQTAEVRICKLLRQLIVCWMHI